MIKVKNGFKYSLTEFKGYKYRAKFVAENLKGEQVINTDIYTDNNNKQDVAIMLCLKAEKKGYVISRHWTGLVHWASKEQDDLNNSFIDEWLKEE